MAKKVLIVDAQIFQTPAWHRGMSKLSFAVLKELVTLPGFQKEWKLSLLFSSNLELSAERESQLRKDLKNPEIAFLDLLAPPTDFAEAHAHNLSALDEHIKDMGPGHVPHFLVPALFEHSIITALPSHVHGHLVFHDLIPLLFPQYYLHNQESKDFYFSRFNDLFAAEKIFTNSMTTLNDLVTYLGITESKLVHMGGAGFSRNKYVPKKPNLGKDLRPFILLPSGDDARKNNINCVKGFALFNTDNQNKYKLVVTSNFGEATKKELLKITDDVVFPGVVSDEEMRWLTQHAEFIVFGPEYEGLGMPILEAVDEGKGIACSNIGVFREISEDAFEFFNPYDPLNISEAMRRTVSRTADTKKYEEIKNRFTWKNSAENLLKGLLDSERLEPLATNKQRIAILGPTPSGYSSIGSFIQQLHPSLKDTYEVDYYLEDIPGAEEIKPSYLPYVARVEPISKFDISRYLDYEAVWYHLGNSEYHLHTLWKALNMPGKVVIHDTNLTGLFDTLVRKGMLTKERYDLEKELSSSKLGSAFLGSVTGRAQAIMVHSEDAKKKIEELNHFKCQVYASKLPVSVPRQSLRLDSQQLTIGLAGILTSEKGIAAINSLLQIEELNDCKFEIFGFNTTGSDILQRIISDKRVNVETNLTNLRFQSKLASLDILVNYRPRYFGETSLLTLEALRHGVCAVVRRIGWFDELPDNTVIKVNNEEELITSIKDAVRSGRENILHVGRAGRQYVFEQHSHKNYIDDMKKINTANNTVFLDSSMKDPWFNILSSGLDAGDIHKLEAIFYQEAPKK